MRRRVMLALPLYLKALIDLSNDISNGRKPKPVTSPWSVPIFTNLTIPSEAGPGQARIVIASELPPPLDSYTWTEEFNGGTFGYASAIIIYPDGDDNDYTYIAAPQQTGGPATLAMHIGQVVNGAVSESGAGQPNVLQFSESLFGAPADGRILKGAQARIEATDVAQPQGLQILGSGGTLIRGNTGLDLQSLTQAILQCTGGVAGNITLDTVNGVSIASGADINMASANDVVRNTGRNVEKAMGIILSKNVAQNVASGGGGAVLTWDNVISDPYSIGLTGGNSFIIPAGWSGIWDFTSYVPWNPNAAVAGFHTAELRVNGTPIVGYRLAPNPTAGQYVSGSPTIPWPVVAGDVIDLAVFQNSGVVKTIGGAGVLEAKLTGFFKSTT